MFFGRTRMSESASGEADTERCRIAQRLASVSRVRTTAETPHNAERQRGGGRGESGRPKKKRRKLRKMG